MNYSAMIQNRRSVHAFREKEVPSEAIGQLRSYYEKTCPRLIPEIATELIALDESRPVGGHKAVVKVADNIIFPLGTTTEENYAAVKAGKSALRLYESSKNLPEPSSPL